MDHITRKAIDEVMADLANDGGGTYQAGTFLPFRPESGFAVAIGGVTLPAVACTEESLRWALWAVGSEFMTSFVGTWLNEGTVYVDGVTYFNGSRRDDAIDAGREHGQLAIYDYATKEAISL